MTSGIYERTITEYSCLSPWNALGILTDKPNQHQIDLTLNYYSFYDKKLTGQMKLAAIEQEILSNLPIQKYLWIDIKHGY